MHSSTTRLSKSDVGGGRRRFGRDEPHAVREGRLTRTIVRTATSSVPCVAALARFGLSASACRFRIPRPGLPIRGLEATAGIEPAYTVLQTVA
jgi:hypothetical protein